MRILICDDNPLFLNMHETLISKLCENKKDRPDIQCYQNGKELLEKETSRLNETGLIFLDVNMDPMDGITLAAELEKRGYQNSVVFLTSDDRRSSYSQLGIDYITLQKDGIDDRVMGELIDKKISSFEENQKMITISDRLGKQTRCLQNSIIYIKKGRKNIVYTQEGNYILKTPYDEMIHTCRKQTFVELSPKYVLNMGYIEDLSNKKVQMKNGTCFALERSQYEKIAMSFSRFLSGNLMQI